MTDSIETSEREAVPLPMGLAVLPASPEPFAYHRAGWGPDCGPYDELYTATEMEHRDKSGWTPLYKSLEASAPIDMVLFCPKCGVQHIDAPEGQFYPGHTAEESAAVNEYYGLWNNPPHRSHLCHGCGHIWRPADVATNGVKAVKTQGKADSPRAAPSPVNRMLLDALQAFVKYADEVGDDSMELDKARAALAAAKREI